MDDYVGNHWASVFCPTAPHERGLCLPRIQRPVRPLRSHHQADHGRKADLRLCSCKRKHSLKETLEEERLSCLRSSQRHAAMEYGELSSVVALKPGVGDHTPERVADHEPRRNANHGYGFAFEPGAMDWKTVKRLNALT